MPASRLPVSLKSLAKLLQSSEISSYALTASAIEAAKASPHGSFSEIYREVAQSAAHAADKRFASGTSLGLLDGVPFAIKDNFCTEFGNTTARCPRSPSLPPPLVDRPHPLTFCQLPSDALLVCQLARSGGF
jgi:aspartyl-tRNA(Asn)/glutamyl-tRNA(Gln) amidotransferase subunit A